LAVEHIHTYLVHPGKRSDNPPQIGGTAVPLKGKLFELLDAIYSTSDNDCNIDISFNPNPDGTQQNPCRDLVVDYLGGPTLAQGSRIAERLEKVTTHRSGLGLLFLITGKEGQDHKIVISRFPADYAILAEEDQKTLSIEFLERVFMKRATAYKAAAYQDSSLRSGFWLGRATDKQTNSSEVQLSNYWIAEFLDSNFRTTPAAGTRRLAVSLRDAAKNSRDVTVKTEIAAAVTLASSLRGQTLTIRDFQKHFGFSDAANQAIANEIKVPKLADERFRFDWEEFSKQIAYRSIELDSGGVLTAQSSDFDKVFHREVVDAAEQKVRFSTEGRVISEKLRKSK
jgi:hypothetical protein